MLVFFQTQLCKILYFFIYLFSFFESKITLIKRKFITTNNMEIFYYKNNELLTNDNNDNNDNNDENVDYDIQILIENSENKRTGKVCTNLDNYEKCKISSDKYFLNIEVTLGEDNDETSYVLSLASPINFYYTNSNILIYEHLHFLMKRTHNINITQDTQYEISIMDSEFKTFKLTNEYYIVFSDNFRYTLVKQNSLVKHTLDGITDKDAQ